jgi:hypothetical protein
MSILIVGETASDPLLFLEHLGFGHLPFYELNPIIIDKVGFGEVGGAAWWQVQQ